MADLICEVCGAGMVQTLTNCLLSLRCPHEADHVPQDKHVREVIGLLRSRAAVGLKKYGVTTERTDLTTVQWIDHAVDELLDAAVYLRTLREKMVEIAKVAASNG